MDTLTTLFGSQARIKIIRLFLFSQGKPLFLNEVTSRSNTNTSIAKKEINVLLKADLIRKRKVSKDIEVKRGKKVTLKKLKGTAYVLNEKFPFIDPLKNLLTIASIQADESLARCFSSAGRIKFLVAAGVFIQNWDSRVDLLIVGDELNVPKIEHIIKNIEANIGKEIAYSAFETADFEYRIGIHDRLVRDILDYPHVTLIDKINVV